MQENYEILSGVGFRGESECLTGGCSYVMSWRVCQGQYSVDKSYMTIN